MIHLLRNITPRLVLRAYHYALSVIAPLLYGNPSKKLIVIGVTGTTGKSSTVNILAHLLEASGAKVGFTTTANFRIGEREWINDTKMTMLGRFKTQRMLADMVRAGCRYAIVETTSQGVEQYRHHGVHYDYLVFTNLYPEHIEAHGSFEKYKEAKGKLFSYLSTLPAKCINGREIKKTFFINMDNEHVDYFLSFAADNKVGVTMEEKSDAQLDRIYNIRNVRLTPDGSEFSFEGTDLAANLVGEFNVRNAGLALAVAFEEGVALEAIETSLSDFDGVPGRMESINEGQNFSVIVDYAFEPKALESLYTTIDLFEVRRIIHVLGGTGGGRDVWRRSVNGNIAAQNADIVIVTDEDPYDDDPRAIMEDVATGAREHGKIESQDLFIVEDRKKAIEIAVEMAGEGDLVLITGKGSEQVIMRARGKRETHDDRAVARVAVKKRLGTI